MEKIVLVTGVQNFSFARSIAFIENKPRKTEVLHSCWGEDIEGF